MRIYKYLLILLVLFGCQTLESESESNDIQFVPPDQFNWKIPIPDNLIFNSDFEQGTKGDRLPDGWRAVSKDNVPKGLEKKPIFPSGAIGGTHRWETEGLGSRHSMSFSVPNGKWYGWQTTVKKIKPNTTYSVTLWYKQPRPYTMQVIAFGKVYDLKYMFKEQPEHWVRMSMLMDSGPYSGQGELAIICKGPGEFWLDHVELYEGTSGIGYERARMELYYYYNIEVSPDMISPVSFGYEHLFLPQSAPEYLEFVLDLPPQVEGVGYTVAIPWSDCTDSCILTKEAVVHHGKIYNRYIIEMPFRARGGYQPFTFPVGHKVGGLVRDEWHRYGVGNYSGLTSLKWFLRTEEEDGHYTGYYFVRWPGSWKGPAGQQEMKSFCMNVVRVPQVPTHKRFVIMPDVKGQEFKVRPNWIKDFQRIGATRLSGHVPKDVSFARNVSKAAERAGFEGFSPWTWLTKDYDKYPKAHGIGLNGERLGSWCLSYRGSGFKAFVKRIKRYAKQGVYRVNLNDEVSWECFCHKCQARFKDYFTKIYPNEEYVDPIQFERTPNKYPKHHQLWKDYFGGMYGEAIIDVKKEVEAYMRKKGINKEFRFSASSHGLFMTQIKIPAAIEPATKVIEDELIQPYIYCYAEAYKGNPKRVGDAIARSVEASKDIAIRTVPLLSPGLGFSNPSCQLDPRSQMKYQILEGALAGMEGYGVYSANAIDLGDLRQMARANRLIVKYEDIILDGEPANDVTFGNLPPELKMMRSLRARRLGERILIYVADYTTYKPISTKLKIRVPVDKPMVVIDAEDETKIAELMPGKEIFEIELKEERGRLLLVKPVME